MKGGDFVFCLVPAKIALNFMKIAILGASGIGKSHARWFARHGQQVVAILGSSDESAAQTGVLLNQEFGFSGLTYSSLTALLQETQPDAVCIATPSTLHFAQALESLEAGAHVLCEKPLVYAPGRKLRENMDGAKELVRLARKKQLVLATQLQYGAATPILCKLAGTSPREVGDFAMEIETFNAHAPREPRELWMDLAPHALSVVQFLGGQGAQLAEDSIRIHHNRETEKTEVTSRFQINCADGRVLTARAILRALDGTFVTRRPLRRFAFNGRVVHYTGAHAPDGTYHAQYITPDGYDNLYHDPVNYLIGDFLSAIRNNRDPLITGELGMQNLEWLIKMAERFEN
jgi:predicted dehydrogenase